MNIITYSAPTAIRAMFMAQTRRAVEAGLCSDGSLDCLYPQISCLREVKEVSGKIPFLIVVKGQPISVLMSKVTFGGRAGVSYLNEERFPCELFDSEKYIILDVEDGTMLLNRRPSECCEIFERQGRVGANVVEVVTLAMHRPECMAEHSLVVVGTKWSNWYWPTIQTPNDVPELQGSWFDQPYPTHGSVSYRGRVG